MKYLLISLILLTPTLLFGQASIQWQKCYGGSENDFPGGLIPTRDGGYIMASATKSTDGDITSSHGDYDLWVVKMNVDGAIEWQRSYGGSHEDEGGAILQTFDGGYLIAASTQSDDGDLQGVGHHGTLESPDIWVLRIDSIGTILWQKTYGGSGYDVPVGLIPGTEGEYVISAITRSSDGDVHGFHTGSGDDSWIFQISESGALGWQHTLGGSKNDDLYSLVQTHDGGYALAGVTYSNDGDITGRHIIDTSNGDFWLVKLSSVGEIQWQKTYGGSKFDESFGLIPTYDNGYAIAGLTFSKDGDLMPTHDSMYFSSCWILKVNSEGDIDWENTYGGSKGDAAYSILQTRDSGYIVSGSTSSDDGDVTGFHGNSDCWVFRLDKYGRLFWRQSLGGSASDANIGSGIMFAADSGYLVATVTSSWDGDVSGRRSDSTDDGDIWLVKLSPEKAAVPRTEVSENSFTVYPNPGNGIEKLTYRLDAPSEIRIEIINQLGEILHTIDCGVQAPGLHESSFDLRSLSSGMYFFRIQTDGVINTKAFELVR